MLCSISISVQKKICRHTYSFIGMFKWNSNHHSVILNFRAAKRVLIMTGNQAVRFTLQAYASISFDPNTIFLINNEVVHSSNSMLLRKNQMGHPTLRKNELGHYTDSIFLIKSELGHFTNGAFLKNVLLGHSTDDMSLIINQLGHLFLLKNKLGCSTNSMFPMKNQLNHSTNGMFLIKNQLGLSSNNILSRNNQLGHSPLAARRGFSYQQKAFLVNCRIKWVKDNVLDRAVEKEKGLKAVCILKDTISKYPGCCLPIYVVSRRRRQLGLDIRVSSFMRRYPTIFEEFLGQENCDVPWFKLTKEAMDLDKEEQRIYQEHEAGYVESLCKVLMITSQRKLPLQTIDQLKWDLGLPEDYVQSLVPKYPDYFSIVKLLDGREGLSLVCWNDDFAISALQKRRQSEMERIRSLNREKMDNSNNLVMSSEVREGKPLAFPMSFMRGFGLKMKFMLWMEEWQRLPYISPYEDYSDLNPNSDLSEKRIVGVFHELLSLMVHKKTERKNLSNLRKYFGLPQKFTKVFTRHPGIFYLSQKCATVTVMLREAYNRAELIQKHPVVAIRERYIALMKIGMLNRSRGLYKRDSVKDEFMEGVSSEDLDPEDEFDGDMDFSEDEEFFGKKSK